MHSTTENVIVVVVVVVVIVASMLVIGFHRAAVRVALEQVVVFVVFALFVKFPTSFVSIVSSQQLLVCVATVWVMAEVMMEIATEQGEDPADTNVAVVAADCLGIGVEAENVKEKNDVEI